MKQFTNFRFHMATDILFGRGVESQVGEMVKQYGGTKVLWVYGGGSIKRGGLYDAVKASLGASSIPFCELPGVQPNPRRSLVDQGLDLARAEGVDFLLAVGGGSAIDTAKAIALGLANDGEYWKFYLGEEPKQIAPVGAIPTIAAAGSESSGSTVLLDDVDTHLKYGLMYPQVRPVFALMNPELTYTVSPYQTGVGAADIFSHSFMRYFIEPASALGDAYCVATMRTVLRFGPLAVQNPRDYEARAELLLAGSFSHNDLTGIGRSFPKKGGEHALERQLSGVYDTAHGAGLAVVMPAMLRYIAAHGSPKQLARVASFGAQVFDAEPDFSDPAATAREGIDRFCRWLQALGMPLTLRELGIPPEDLPQVIERCGTVSGYMDFDRAAVAEIFTSVAQ